MTRFASVVLGLSLWFGIGLAAQQPGQGSLRASLEREATRLASTLATEDVSAKGSTAFNISAAQTERLDDWGAVQRLEPGTRVRITPRQGRTIRGRLTGVTESGVLTDNGAVLRADVDSVGQVPGGQSLSVAAYGGLGIALGAATLAIAASAGCTRARGCSELGQAMAVPAGLFYGALWGGMTGFVTGEVVHHRPERTVYVRGQQ